MRPTDPSDHPSTLNNQLCVTATATVKAAAATAAAAGGFWLWADRQLRCTLNFICAAWRLAMLMPACAL